MPLTPVDCTHWENRGAAGGCRLGLGGGRPSPGVCGRCPRRDPVPPGVRLSTHVGPSFAVPPGWRGDDYRLDAKGTAGCGCA